MKPAELIMILNKEHRYTQKEIAAYMGCKQAAVSKYLRGVDIPSAKFLVGLIKLARKERIKVTIEDLVN